MNGDSVEDGIAALDKAIRDSNAPIIVCSHSQYEGDIRDVIKGMVFDA